MRTWGRITNKDGTRGPWVSVEDASGDFSYGWIATLCQVLLLALNESPFYANYGIPAQRSVIQQIIPDFYVNTTQSQFSQYFASLTITRRPPVANGRTVNLNPTYDIAVVTFQGTSHQFSIAT